MARAALILILGMALIPLGDSAGKILVERHGVAPVFVAWTRFLIGAGLVLPTLSRRHIAPRLFLDPRVLLRAGLIVAGIVCILTALGTEPLPNVFGAFFVGPLFSFLLSALFLREPVGPMRSALVLAGFAGVLLVVRPGFGMTPGLAFAGLAGLFYGAFLTASRWLSGLAAPRGLLMTQMAFGAVVLAPVALRLVPPLGPEVALLLLASALASAAANLLLAVAYRMAPATRLAPFVYFQLVAATFCGWAIFGDLPDGTALAGLGLLVGSGAATLALRR